MRVEPELRRSAILDKASMLFLAHGYAGTSMTSIASATGGSKTTLYNYFSSKREIFAALVSNLAQEWRTAGATVSSSDAIERHLLEIGRRHLAVLISPRIVAIRRLVAAEVGRCPELGKLFYESGLTWDHFDIISAISSRIERQELRRTDPEIAALHFRALCEAGIVERYHWNVAGKDRESEIDESVKRGVETFLMAYRI